MKTLGLFTVSLLSTQAMAWGGRGHHTVCSAAVHLVQDKGLREFLKHRPHTMGHLCNIPDIYWKSLSRSDTKHGDAAHFIDPEVTGLPFNDVSLDFAKLEKDLQGKPNPVRDNRTIYSPADELGTLWWRVDQFMRRMAGMKEEFSKAAPPANGKEEQNDELAYNKAVYALMVDMGLMGHFVGDAGQPLHNGWDYDGYAAGHGGLHSYYEELSVAAAPADLEAKVAASGARIKKAAWLEDKPVVELMKKFSEITRKDIDKVFAQDPILKKSEKKKEKGMDLKTPAQRQSAEVGWKKFENLIVTGMGRSAKFLASLWERAYISAGRPDLSKYRSYRYPFTPDFVQLDYVTAVPEKKEKE